MRREVIGKTISKHVTTRLWYCCCFLSRSLPTVTQPQLSHNTSLIHHARDQNLSAPTNGKEEDVILSGKQYTNPFVQVLIPNSPRPLIHYRNVFSSEQDYAPLALHDRFARNGWATQWIWRYGKDQTSHYHSAAHECMVVLTGTATIRFGVADISDDASGTSKEEGGIYLEASAGDVFVLPAGTAHKTFDTLPEAPLKLLTPGDGQDRKSVV